MTQGREPFWMVYGIGQGAPTARHKYSGSAISEAKRLARNNPGIEFVVLEAIHFAVKRDVDVVELRPASDSDDGIPF